MNTLLDIKSFFQFLKKNIGYTLIDVFGLSVSLMFVILIGLYSWEGLSTDRYHEKGDRIYAIGTEDGIGWAWRIGERMADHYPEIEEMCPVIPYPSRTIVLNENTLQFDVLLAGDNFFDMFSFQLLQGDKATVLDANNSAVISESFARRAFPDRNPMGQTIALQDSVHVTVNGIMKDIKNSTIPYSDVLINVNNVKFYNASLDSPTGNNALGCAVFFLAHKGADLQAKADDMVTFVKDFFWMYKLELQQKITLTPLKDVYFSELLNYIGLENGDWQFVIILMSIGILILLFAIINYINLTVAQTGKRAKEMATRRLLGSSRGELFYRLIMESTILSFISFVIGLLLAYAALPFANDLLQARISITDAITPVNIALAILLIAVLGFVAGLLPAMIISNSKPIDIVRGGFRRKTKMVFSKVFITFQNTITIALLAAALTMALQIDHLIKAPLGYNSTNIISLTTQGFTSRNMIDAFANETRQLASVNRVVYAIGTPFDRGNNSTIVYEEKNISFQVLTGDTAYFNMFGFEVLHDNNLSGRRTYLNEQAMLEMELPMDAESVALFGNTIPLAGVVRDFQLRNVTHQKQPVILNINNTMDENNWPWSLGIEVKGEPFAAREQVKDVYERITKLPFDAKFIDQQVQDSFEAQSRTAQIVSVFAIIAIIISLLGLLAMSTYFIQQRSREIAVRKVFGSNNYKVLKDLVSTFLMYVVVAFVIATPIVWFVMNKWIADYSYRITLSPWIFIAAGLACLLMSFITVYWQSYRAANANPVKSIKSE